MIERHDKLEAMIGDTPFLVGDRPTLADGVLIGVARWLEFHEVAEVERWPRLAALRAADRGRPGDASMRWRSKMARRPAGSGACVGHVPLAEVIERFGVRRLAA